MKTNNKLRKSELRKLSIVDNLNSAKKLKESIISYKKELDNSYKSKNISFEEYKNNYTRVLKGRSVEQWMEYYDECIDYYNSQLKKLETKRNPYKWLILIAAIILLIFITNYTGFVINDLINTTFINESVENIIIPIENITGSENNKSTTNVPEIMFTSLAGEDEVHVLAYANCPDTTGNLTLSTTLVWGNATMVCGNITITSTGKLLLNSTAAGNKTINITTEILQINNGGILTTRNMGYLPRQGPGSSSVTATSGSYGGQGGCLTQTNLLYGSITHPQIMGSGGGSATRTSGVGAGAVFINASNYIIVNGILDSNASLLTAGSNSGSGSGGSVYLITNQLNGSGIIAAEGGRNGQGVDPSCAGGGGRIAIYYNQNNFIGTISAKGGTTPSSDNGGAGTIYLKSNNQDYGEIIVANQNLTSRRFTYINSSFLNLPIIDNLSISNGASLVLEDINLTVNNTLLEIPNNNYFLQNATLYYPIISTLNLSGDLELSNNYFFNESMNFSIFNGGNLSHRKNNDTQLYFINLTVATLYIDSSSFINATGMGYANDQGPCRAIGSNIGGSYGGVGSSQNPINTFGSITQPTSLGCGGATNFGGGLVILNVTGTFTNDGSISVSGAQSRSQGSTGSGGSALINVIHCKGNGSILSEGGMINSPNSVSYGGGGGRIALYCTQSYNYTGDFKVKGGNNYALSYFTAGAGTIFLKTPSHTYGEIIIANANTSNSGYTYINSSFLNLSIIDDLSIRNGTKLLIENISLTVNSTSFIIQDNDTFIQNSTLSYPRISTLNISGNLILSNDYFFNNSMNVSIFSGGILSNPINPEIRNVTLNQINISASTINIYSGGLINVTDSGFRGSKGLGYVNSGGAGHGGIGGNVSSTVLGGTAYGSLTFPMTYGSGAAATAFGAGNILLNVSGTLLVKGKIIASAVDGSSDRGSGGSITIIADTLAGNDSILAQGGKTTQSTSGGGAGGRISLYLKNTIYTGQINVSGGDSLTAGWEGNLGSLFICKESSSTKCNTFDNSHSIVSSRTNSIQLITNYTQDNSISINKTINVSFSSTTINWTDEISNINSKIFYTILGLQTSTQYKIYENGILNTTLTTNSTGGLPTFNLSGSIIHDVVVEKTAGSSIIGINLDDSIMDFGSGYYNPNCTTGYGIINSNQTKECWINTTTFIPTTDGHLISNNGTVAANITARLQIADAEEFFCNTAQGCTATSIASIKISAIDNEVGSCTGFGTDSLLANNANNFTNAVCNSLSSTDSANQIKTYLELSVPKDSRTGAKQLMIVYEAIAT